MKSKKPVKMTPAQKMRALMNKFKVIDEQYEGRTKPPAVEAREAGLKARLATVKAFEARTDKKKAGKRKAAKKKGKTPRRGIGVVVRMSDL